MGGSGGGGPCKLRAAPEPRLPKPGPALTTLALWPRASLATGSLGPGPRPASEAPPVNQTLWPPVSRRRPLDGHAASPSEPRLPGLASSGALLDSPRPRLFTPFSWFKEAPKASGKVRRARVPNRASAPWLPSASHSLDTAPRPVDAKSPLKRELAELRRPVAAGAVALKATSEDCPAPAPREPPLALAPALAPMASITDRVISSTVW